MTNNLRNNKTAEQGANKLLVALSVALGLLLLIDYFEPKTAEPIQQTIQAEQANPLAPSKGDIFNEQKPSFKNVKPIEVKSDQYTAFIDLVGGKITKLELNNYTTAIDSDKLVSIFNTKQEDQKTAMLFDAGWLSNKFTSPDANTTWNLVANNGDSIVLRYENNGVTFTRTFKFNADSFVISIFEDVVNNSGEPIKLANYAQIHHIGERENKLTNSFTNYAGPEALVNGEKILADYKDLQEGKNFDATGDKIWAGITTQYFAAAIVPPLNQTSEVQFKYNKIGVENYYTALVRSDVKTLENNQSLSETFELYAGPKSPNIIDQQPISKEVNLAAMLDYGWFHFFAKLIYDSLMWINQYVHSLAISIIIVTLILKILVAPLSIKSYISMAKIREIQPQMKKITEKYGPDRQAASMEMMALYKKHNISPAGGCWPMLVQIPIFFAMYKVILMSFEFRQADLGFWITDMSSKDPLFILPIIMGATMILQQKLNPQPLDETQEMVMKVMPFAFTGICLFLPAGLVFYWIVNNIITIAQQYFIIKKYSH